MVGGSEDGPGGLGLRQTAEAAALVSAMKLVTVQVRTSVISESVDESWRGDVRASVRVPVVLHYGTDLSRMDASDVSLSLVAGVGRLAGGSGGPGAMEGIGAEYVVRVPEPVRLATEVLTANESASVSVGWLRFRSMGGERELGRARTGAYPAAQSVVLTREQEDDVREQTRERIEQLVRGIVGPRAGVHVVFAPAGAGTHAGALGDEVEDWASGGAGGRR